MSLRKPISYLAALLLLAACTKQDEQPKAQTPANPAFSAIVNGIPTNFTNPVAVKSEKSTGGNYELKISGTNKLSPDSSIQISFTIPDFTRSGTLSADHSLNTNFNGHFSEWKFQPGSTAGKYHFYQQGVLSVQASNERLAGTFSFKYFLFDKLGNKTGEVEVVNGAFTDITIER